MRRWQLIALLLIVLATGCSGPQPILIGYAAQLTGPHSDLGVDGRDGALLAVEVLNASGGVVGRPLELLVRDDRGDPAVAQQVDAELIEHGVIALIGHSTSSQTAAVFEQMNQIGVVLISPTSSSHEFSAQDDYFFRMTPATSLQARVMARYLHDSGLTRITGVFDQNNLAFTKSYWQQLADELLAHGVQANTAISFSSGSDNPRSVAYTLAASQPTAVVLLASAFDTALLTQAFRQIDPLTPIFTTTWAQTNELLVKGGAAVEGLQLLALYNPESTHPAFQEFRTRFEQRYRRPPSFAAVYSYEAVLVLAEGLRRSDGKAEGLREALRDLGRVTVLQGELVFDQYGDVRRDLFLTVVRDGQFVVDAILPFTVEARR
jgi:branched-chain amino acid transport system substrate-binding protein